VSIHPHLFDPTWIFAEFLDRSLPHQITSFHYLVLLGDRQLAGFTRFLKIQTAAEVVRIGTTQSIGVESGAFGHRTQFILSVAKGEADRKVGVSRGDHHRGLDSLPGERCPDDIGHQNAFDDFIAKTKGFGGLFGNEDGVVPSQLAHRIGPFL